MFSVNLFQNRLAEFARPILVDQGHATVQTNVTNGSTVNCERAVTVGLWLVTVFQTKICTQKKRHRERERRKLDINQDAEHFIFRLLCAYLPDQQKSLPCVPDHMLPELHFPPP